MFLFTYQSNNNNKSTRECKIWPLFLSRMQCAQVKKAQKTAGLRFFVSCYHLNFEENPKPLVMAMTCFFIVVSIKMYANKS